MLSKAHSADEGVTLTDKVVQEPAPMDSDSGSVQDGHPSSSVRKAAAQPSSKPVESLLGTPLRNRDNTGNTSATPHKYHIPIPHNLSLTSSGSFNHNTNNTAKSPKRKSTPKPARASTVYTTTSTTTGSDRYFPSGADNDMDPPSGSVLTPMRGPFLDDENPRRSSYRSSSKGKEPEPPYFHYHNHSSHNHHPLSSSPQPLLTRRASNPFFPSFKKKTDSQDNNNSPTTATATSPPSPSVIVSPPQQQQHPQPQEGMLQFIVDAFTSAKSGLIGTSKDDSAINQVSSTSRRPSTSHNVAQSPTGSVVEDKENSTPIVRRASEGDSRNKAAATAHNRWAALRTRLRTRPTQFKERLSKSLNGTDLVSELSTGHLAVLMLKMHFDRDEHEDRRVPVLLNYLKIRITESANPLHNSHALFRIELDYGNGLVKWVIYRELRDFLNLHAHYRVANFKNSTSIPTFPKTSLPYFNFLKKEGRAKSGTELRKSDFARIQRQAVEDYLLKLIRATMFRPEANRLCKFLEFSAATVHFAASGGLQGKQGYLYVASSGTSRRNAVKFGPTGIQRRRQPKWFAVRESYVVALYEPGEFFIWDVILFDSSFSIELPQRLYKQGMRMITNGYEHHVRHNNSNNPDKEKQQSTADYYDQQQITDPNENINDADNDKKKKKDPIIDTASHTFYINNSERRIKLVAKNERQMEQFIASLTRVSDQSIWMGKNRFNSFAPIRMKVQAQWLIDGRDYFWNLSRAIAMAKKTIYIHDWWLSPELYFRRPASENGRWRLDRLFKRKADQGVKIFIIVYKEVSNDFTPVESVYTKNRLRELSPNIHVQRSPSHAQTGTYLWSHHEKMCVIDDTIAFMGGLDQCFGRWDTSSHIVVDESPFSAEMMEEMHNNHHNQPKGKRPENIPEHDVGQIWPGKDYSNSRVSDFFQLTKPETDMYDRTKVPRQPWHDIGLQLIGQPARDLGRHFIQRWNYLLRTKNHTRFMPFLVPAPDFSKQQLINHKLIGSCEAQICRSVSPWSIGTPKVTEHSIQNAYIKAIQMSEHFVYIENQFFCTSAVVENVEITNRIGDALVDRIKRAYQEETPWRAIIIIPLLPGYPMSLDQAEASSVRLITNAQYFSISSGDGSVFGRLRAEGIEPDHYISFFSLRAWGQMQSGKLVTQDVYIHAKAMIVDDRIAIIGSANINDRSQRGDRDSELACVIRDTEMIDSKMAGQPFKVGKFAHTMRVRLMREHLGLDIDTIEEEHMQQMAQAAADSAMANVSVTRQGDAPPVDHHDDLNHTIQEEGSESISPISKRSSKSSSSSSYPGDSGEKSEEFVTDDNLSVHNFAEDEQNDPFYQPAINAATNVATSIGETMKSMIGGDDNNNNQANSNSPSQVNGHGSQSDSKEKDRKLSITTTPKSEESHQNGSVRMNTIEEASKQDSAIRQEKERQREKRLSTATANGNDHQNLDAVAVTAPNGRPRARSSGVFLESPITLKEDSTADSSLKHQKSSISRNSSNLGGILNNNDNRTSTTTIRHNRFGSHSRTNPYMVNGIKPNIDVNGFEDPLDPSFYDEVWNATAKRNSLIFRKVFKCTPDDMVKTWTQFREYETYYARHEKPLRNTNSSLANAAAGTDGISATPVSTTDNSLQPDSSSLEPSSTRARSKSTSNVDGSKAGSKNPELGFTSEEREQMLAALEEVDGHLVTFPTKFLETVIQQSSFLWTRDRLQPMNIFI